MSTSSIAQVTTGERQRTERAPGRRGIALALVLGAQLMVILDMTVVNIALPSIARGLHFSEPSLSWVLNAYTLTFGGCSPPPRWPGAWPPRRRGCSPRAPYRALAAPSPRPPCWP
jgi:MFS family permease